MTLRIAPMNFRGRGRGFTLLEILLSLALSAMIALSLYVAMNAGFKARTSAYAQLDVPRQAALLLDHIEQLFQSGLPATTDRPFVGYNDEIDFYTINRDVELGDHPFADGLRWMAIFLRNQQNQNDLVEQITRNLLSTVTEDPEETVLARDVRLLSFRYYDGTDWQTSWDSTEQSNQLPRAVEVTLELDKPVSTNPNARYRMMRIFPLPWSTPASSSDSETGGGT